MFNFFHLPGTVAAVGAEQPPVPRGVSGALRAAVIGALRLRDAAAVQELLAHTVTLAPSVALRSVWLPIAVGIGAWNAAGSPLGACHSLARTLRAQVRSAQLSLSPLVVSRWLVPSSGHDITAAHLAALALSLRGLGACVWTWSLPPPGPALLVGEGGCPVATIGRIPTLSDEPGWPSLVALVA